MRTPTCGIESYLYQKLPSALLWAAGQALGIAKMLVAISALRMDAAAAVDSGPPEQARR